MKKEISIFYLFYRPLSIAIGGPTRTGKTYSTELIREAFLYLFILLLVLKSHQHLHYFRIKYYNNINI